MDSIRLDRFKSYDKHHTIVERYMWCRNPKRVASRERWDGLKEAGGSVVELETSGSGVAGRKIE